MSESATAMDRGEGVQVVRLGQGEQRCELDLPALQRVLLRTDVRDLPVVVVSVAGAFRGGKSFMLDFFLRYLNASRSSQLSKDWLGREDEPLKGFHWRGGSEPDTSGIHLWSQPIVTTLPSGEKVAVLLMDTQGTFDSESTIGDTSTIFALSTLVSSVQIYNLFRNIREDHLQHLQLFTEYGKLACACDPDEKAFQTLIFLVRDWPHYNDHAYGFAGGEGLLNKRLESKPTQKAELREVREQINSCFDKIKCFLMPNPGSLVEEHTHTGCLRDISEKFRLQLLELVPALFHPEHLTPKLINGDRVRTQDLLEYFHKYVDVFNSDDVPEALTIFKATAAACLQAATRAARDLYAARMEQHVRDDVSVRAATLANWHDIARGDALDCYAEKKKLGSPSDVQFHLEELENELNARLSLYMLNNEAKAREAVRSAKHEYWEQVRGVCAEPARVCLHPAELRTLHDVARAAALARFQAARYVPEEEHDEERAALLQSLEQQYEDLCKMNEQNNSACVAEVVEEYRSRMRAAAESGVVGAAELRARHAAAVEDAREQLRRRRDRDTSRDDDPYLQRLLQEIESCFADIENTNANSIKQTLQTAEYAYRDRMLSAWGPPNCCFHPRGLEDLHKGVKQEVLKEFIENRADDDEFKAKLETSLEERYSEFKTTNEFNNKEAVALAFGEYTKFMDKRSRPGLVSVLVVPFIAKLLKGLPAAHDNAKQVAKNTFMERRRGTDYDDDKYYNGLMKKIQSAYEDYTNPMRAIGREIGFDFE